MSEFVCIGKIVNTHGIKGEVRVLSDFEKKELVFKKEMTFYVGELKKEFKVVGYRHHKMFDMVIFDGVHSINDVLEYKGKKVYVKREDLKLLKDDYLYEDLIGFTVYDEDKEIGNVSEVWDSKGNVLLQIKYEKYYYIPLKSEYIKKIDLENHKIITSKGSELIL